MQPLCTPKDNAACPWARTALQRCSAPVRHSWASCSRLAACLLHLLCNCTRGAGCGGTKTPKAGQQNPLERKSSGKWFPLQDASISIYSSRWISCGHLAGNQRKTGSTIHRHALRDYCFRAETLLRQESAGFQNTCCCSCYCFCFFSWHTEI